MEQAAVTQSDRVVSGHVHVDAPQRRPTRGGLAPWQIRNLLDYIASHFDAVITSRELALTARLSTFHFCRAFRDSFGTSPNVFVSRRRIELAQQLMLTTDASLATIAADCGLADQAHLNKMFRRIVGEAPGAWRRAQTSGTRC